MNMTSKLLTDKRLLGFLAGMLSVVVSGNASAAELFAIITNFGTAPRVKAHFEVAVDSRTAPRGTDILFNVFNANGDPLAEFTVQTNEHGFASTASALGPNRNLFRVTNGEPGVVRGRTPVGATATTGLLHQRGPDTRLIIGVAPTLRADNTPLSAGRLFPIAIGNVRSATLLIGNVSGGEVQVDVFIGTKGPDGGGIPTNPRLSNNGLWRVDLTPDQLNAHLVVASSGDIIVQLMIDDGRVYGITCLPG